MTIYSPPVMASGRPGMRPGKWLPSKKYLKEAAVRMEERRKSSDRIRAKHGLPPTPMCTLEMRIKEEA